MLECLLDGGERFPSAKRYHVCCVNVVIVVRRVIRVFVRTKIQKYTLVFYKRHFEFVVILFGGRTANRVKDVQM